MAFVLSAALLGAFSACGTLYVAQINWDVDLSNPIDIKMLYPETGMPGFGSDHTAELIERSTGYKGIYEEVTGSNADNEINNILSTQKEYHIMKLTEAQYHPYVANGTFLDLTELLEKTESGRILYELIDLMPYGWDSVKYTDEDGNTGIYAIPDFGYTVMEDYGLVWNTKHLEEIGWYETHDSVPQTISELTEAFLSLQEYFGEGVGNPDGPDPNYHAFGIGGANSAAVEIIMSAFDAPGATQFYVDENGEIQMYIYHEGVTKYLQYMNMLRKEGVISASWQSSSSADICNKFASEYNSCLFLTYWWLSPLCDTVVANGTMERYGMTNDYETVHDELLAWNTRIRGDGTYNSSVQEKAKHIGDASGVSYYTVIPFYMAEDAVYIIDYLSKKLQNFALFYGGEEGVDWKVVDAPADGQENWAEKIIYMDPWEYEVNGETVTGGGKWIQLTQSYVDYIVDNSQYCTGTNPVEAKVLFHLREVGFDAWPVAVPDDDTIIHNPMTMMPVLEHWAPISILSRTTALRGMATAIDYSGDAEAAINITRESLKVTSAKRNGVTYYYWSDEISKEMTEWYNTVKLGGTTAELS